MKFLVHFLTLLLFSAPAFSAVLYGEVRGDKFHWRTIGSSPHAQSLSVPTFWDLPSALPAASAWIPGSIQGNNELTIELRHEKSESSASITIKIEGIEYMLTGYSCMTGFFNCFGDNDGDAFTSIPLGNLVAVKGVGLGDRVFKNKNPNSTYFSHIRPLFTIKNNVVDSFQNLPEGRYQGTVSFHSQHDYYRVFHVEDTDNNIKIRNSNRHNLTVRIENYRNKLNEIDVLGSDLMQTTYSKDKVSAETTYTVVNKGYFSNGITAKLQPSRNGYRLTHENGESSIEYSAQCIRGCEIDNFFFIEKGEGKTGNGDTTEIKTIDYERAVAEIKVSFSDVPLSDLEEGRYAGSFTLTFELNEI